MRIVMMGTGSFAEPTFAALLQGPHTVVGLFTQPDRATGKERGSTRQANPVLKTLALERGIPVLQPESINTPDGVASLHALAPDLLVVAAYGQILSNDVLASATHGGINVHASLLPKYRGAAPINWAIYHGETKTGVTIIRMSTALDAGDILAQAAVDILPDESAGGLEARLGPLGAKLAVAIVDRIATGQPVPGVKQDKSQVTKAPKLTKEHGLIDWSRPAEAVCNHIRAMQPYPTAYTYLHRDGQPPLRLIVLKARVLPGEAAPVGTVRTDAMHKQLLVACGQGAVEIVELQPAGKRRMSASDFLRGNVLTSGARMGPEA
jgi:methionyl-tRNA formyltransferase